MTEHLAYQYDALAQQGKNLDLIEDPDFDLDDALEEAELEAEQAQPERAGADDLVQEIDERYDTPGARNA